MTYDKSMTKTPFTDAYVERMKRRDDPNDYGVCEHNVLVQHDPNACKECRK